MQIPGVNSRNLRRNVRPHAHHAPAELVSDFEGMYIKVVRRTDQKRIQKFDQRCYDKLITPALIKIEDIATQCLQHQRLWRQHLLNALWQ